jgi:nucleotide sugar dehydrogenase
VKEVIGVVGQGYVGLPLALEISRNGFSVIGVDTNQSLVDALNSGHSSIEDISGEDILKELEANRYKASTDYSHIKSCQIILVCVPTPLNGKTPDLKFLIHAISNIGYHLDKGDLVIVESTVEPETTREILLPILEKNSKLNRKDFYVAFSPERIDPTNQKWGIKNTPKLVAGFNQESKLKAM